MRSDFYVMKHDESLVWEGSAFKNGGLHTTPLNILIQANRTMFEEAVLDYLREVSSANKYNGDAWPWPWSDSRMTDYTYIFHECMGKVLMSQEGGRLVDPIKIIQGMDMIGADVGIGLIKFPIMRKDVVEQTEEFIKQYGLQSTKTV